MADGFDNQCLSCSERWRDVFGHLSFEDFAAHANTTAGAEDLAQYENTKAGTEPDWIPEDVLAQTSTRVCVERSVLVLTAAEYKTEMGKPLPGSRGLKLPTMMLLSEQNPVEYEEHFVFQDPDHPYRRAVVKQELAVVRRSHRLDVHQNAYESQEEQIHKTSARSSVEKLSIKSIFNVHTVLASLPATNVEGEPRVLREKIGTSAQQGASVHVGQQEMSANKKMLKMPRGHPVLGLNKPVLLHSRRLPLPLPPSSRRSWLEGTSSTTPHGDRRRQGPRWPRTSGRVPEWPGGWCSSSRPRKSLAGACQHLRLRLLAGRCVWSGTSWRTWEPSARSCRFSILLCRRRWTT